MASQRSYSPQFLANVRHLNQVILQAVTAEMKQSEFLDLRPIFKCYEEKFRMLEEDSGGNDYKKADEMDTHVESSSTTQLSSKQPPVSKSFNPDKVDLGTQKFSKGDSNNAEVVDYSMADKASNGKPVSSANAPAFAPKFSFSAKLPSSTTATTANELKISTTSTQNTMFSSSSSKEPPTLSFMRNNAQNNNNAQKSSNTESAPPFQGMFGSNTPTPALTGFKFGASSSKPPSADAKQLEPKKPEVLDNNAASGDAEDEPPVPEQVEVSEPGAFYEQPICLLVKSEDGALKEKGIASLFLKKCDDGSTQMIIRARHAMKSLWLNVLLKSCAITRHKKRSVALICAPNPPIPNFKKPVAQFFLRCDDEGMAQKLVDVLEKNKK